MSDEIDLAVRTRGFASEPADEPHRLPITLKVTAPHVLPLRSRGRLLFNGPVLGMRGENQASQLLPAPSGSGSLEPRDLAARAKAG